MTQPNPYGNQPTTPGAPEQGKKKMGKGKLALIIIGILVVIGIFSSIAGGGEDKDSTASSSSSVEATSEAPSSDEQSPAEESSQDSSGDATREQKNALRSAKNYLNVSAFSDQGLRNQLEFENFPPDAIDYALANVEVDWNEQAAKKAQAYEKTGMGMSDSRLYDQLVFDGFTPEQAQYGVDNL